MILALHSPSFGRPITTAAIEGGTVDRAAIDLWAVAVVGVAARSAAVTAAGVIKRKFRAPASLPPCRREAERGERQKGCRIGRLTQRKGIGQQQRENEQTATTMTRELSTLEAFQDSGEEEAVGRERVKGGHGKGTRVRLLLCRLNILPTSMRTGGHFLLSFC